jgi:hypothetical protein
VFAPIPIASESIAVEAKIGLRRSNLAAKQTSCHQVSRVWNIQIAHIFFYQRRIAKSTFLIVRTCRSLPRQMKGLLVVQITNQLPASK